MHTYKQCVFNVYVCIYVYIHIYIYMYRHCSRPSSAPSDSLNTKLTEPIAYAVCISYFYFKRDNGWARSMHLGLRSLPCPTLLFLVCIPLRPIQGHICGTPLPSPPPPPHHKFFTLAPFPLLLQYHIVVHYLLKFECPFFHC